MILIWSRSFLFYNDYLPPKKCKQSTFARVIFAISEKIRKKRKEIHGPCMSETWHMPYSTVPHTGNKNFENLLSSYTFSVAAPTKTASFGVLSKLVQTHKIYLDKISFCRTENRHLIFFFSCCFLSLSPSPSLSLSPSSVVMIFIIIDVIVSLSTNAICVCSRIKKCVQTICLCAEQHTRTHRRCFDRRCIFI